MTSRSPEAAGPAPVRVGRIEFVNCFPLYHHFESELARRGHTATLIDGDPAKLNAMLAEGVIDVALPSSIAFARQASRWVILPTVSISSYGAVDSVQLFTRTPLADLRRVEVTAKSATSVCLLRILFDAWGLSPQIEVRDVARGTTARDAGGLLLIGDEALNMLDEGAFPWHFDLGHEWYALTGMPMVFALCAARRTFAEARPEAAAAVGASLLASRDECARHPSATAAAAALAHGFSEDYLRRYFDKLKFGYTSEYRAGLREFYRRAAGIGELENVPDLASATTTPAMSRGAGASSP